MCLDPFHRKADLQLLSSGIFYGSSSSQFQILNLKGLAKGTEGQTFASHKEN